MGGNRNARVIPVAVTGHGRNTGNAVRERSSVIVVLDTPTEQNDSFELIRVGGGYQQKKTSTATETIDDKHVKVRFEKLKPSGSYKLVQTHAKGASHVIFTQVPAHVLATTANRNNLGRGAILIKVSLGYPSPKDRAHDDLKGTPPNLGTLRIEDKELAD